MRVGELALNFRYFVVARVTSRNGRAQAPHNHAVRCAEMAGSAVSGGVRCHNADAGIPQFTAQSCLPIAAATCQERVGGIFNI